MEALSTAIRPLAQPITHNLPAPIRDLGVSIIGERCYETLLLDVRLDHPECLKLAVSKALGIGIIAASSIVKVPQILKLVNSRSAEGVSFLAYLLETSAYLITLAYNVRNGFPFSTFGETALILGQNVVISVLVLNYTGRASMAAVLVAALVGAAGALFSTNLLDMRALSVLQAGAGLLGVASKLPQILAIYQQGGTGQLSAFAVGYPGRWRFARQSLILSAHSGLQLPRRLAVAHLHHPARGRRQAHLVRLRVRLHPQCDPRDADGLLLGRALGEGKGQAQGAADQGKGGALGDNDVDQEPDHAPPRIDGWRSCILLWAAVIL